MTKPLVAFHLGELKMLTKVESQKIDEIKMEFEAIETAMAHLAEKRHQLETQLARVNLIQQVEYHGVTRTSPSCFVNGRNKLEFNSGN